MKKNNQRQVPGSREGKKARDAGHAGHPGRRPGHAAGPRPAGSRLAALSIGLLALYAGFLLLILGACLHYLAPGSFAGVFRSADLRFAMRLSLATTTASAALALVFAVPMGYALNRCRFPGRLLVDTVVDIPLVLPPLVIGVALLVFFRTPLGRLIEGAGLPFVYTRNGIVLVQFLSITPYALRPVKAAFDSFDPRLEQVARTLGWSEWQVFFRVTVPMVRNGIVAGGVLAWAVAMGLFGPIMVFAGTTRQKTEVLATSVYLELSIGRIMSALAISLFMVALAFGALFLFKRTTGGRELL